MNTNYGTAPMFWGEHESGPVTPLQRIVSALEDATWDETRRSLWTTYSIAFDGCHQISLITNEYLHRSVWGSCDLVPVCHTNEGIEQALEQVQEWFGLLCPAKFIRVADDVADLDWHGCNLPALCLPNYLTGARSLIEALDSSFKKALAPTLGL